MVQPWAVNSGEQHLPSSNIQPVVASDGVSQFLAVWTSYTGQPYSFDLFAQRYLNISGVVAAGRAVCLCAVYVEQQRLSAAIAGFLAAVAGHFHFQL